jgi:hypothetical protein
MFKVVPYFGNLLHGASRKYINNYTQNTYEPLFSFFWDDRHKKNKIRVVMRAIFIIMSTPKSSESS